MYDATTASQPMMPCACVRLWLVYGSPARLHSVSPSFVNISPVVRRDIVNGNPAIVGKRVYVIVTGVVRSAMSTTVHA